MSPAHFLWIRDPIAAESLPEVFGFSNVNDVVLGIPHLVNAGMFGDLAKKPLAQPFDERLFWREQKLLARRHGDQNTPGCRKDKCFQAKLHQQHKTA